MYGPKGLRINAVDPGPIITNINGAILASNGGRSRRRPFTPPSRTWAEGAVDASKFSLW